MEAAATAVAVTLGKLCLSRACSAVGGEVAHLRSMRTEMEHICRELELMQDFLKGRNDTEHTCVKQVRDLAGDFEDCVLEFDDYYAKVSSSPRAWSWLPGPLTTSHGISTRIRELNKRNEHLRHHVQLLSQHQQQQQLPPYYHVPSPAEISFQQLEIIGRSSEAAELKDLISGGDGARLGVVSVWGMGGIGKSSLVSMVCNEPELLDAYDCGAWVTVPHAMDNTDNTDEFIQLLRKQFGLGAAAAHNDLQDHLKDKRYMIVVDDLLSQQEWDQVWKELIKLHNANRSRVIVTTRREDVAEYCSGIVGEGHGHVYQLKPLSHKESWNLLCKKVYNTTNCTFPVEMENQAASYILQRCRGLPLAISIIGGILANRPKTGMEWMTLHEHLGPELESDFQNIHKVITSSYDGLPYHMKSIIKYLCIFQGNHEIRSTRLLRRLMAEGYIPKNHDIPVDELGELLYNQLINTGMIRPSNKNFIPGVRVGRFLIHTVVLQFFLSKAVEENQVFIIQNQCNFVPQGKIRHLVLFRWKTGEKLKNINLSSLRSLTFFGACPSSLISPEMLMLRVLDLEGTTNVRNEDLKKIGKLHHLRYLSLRGTMISMFPFSFQNLRYLETLDIEDTQVKKLPQGIIKLEKLRYLLAGVSFSRDLLQKIAQREINNQKANLMGNMTSFPYRNRSDNCMISNMDKFSARAPEGVEKLRNLHKLGVFNVDQGNGVAGSLEKLTNLQKLGVTVTGFNEEEGHKFCQSIGKLGKLQRLEVRSHSIEFLAKMDETSAPKHLFSLKLLGDLFMLPNWIASLDDLTKVKMLGTKLEQGQVDILGNLPKVAFLGLWEKSYIGESLLFSTGKFPKLKFLEIDGLEKIQMVTIDEGAMPELRRLCVTNCKALCDRGGGLSGVPSLVNMTELFV